jgi:hypothetical protein
MNYHESNRLSDSECTAEFAKMFPAEYWSKTAMVELAPLGWERSPLRFAFHPTLEQVYEESVIMHRNLQALRKGDAPSSPEPTLAEIRAGRRETPLEPHRELRELLGRCVWDLFSNNHEVISAEGRILDLGSFRASGAFIAEFLNGILHETRYGYMDFYMGSLWLASRVELTAVYESVFRRLKDHGFDWICHFPRLMLVDVRHLLDDPARKTGPESVGYSPEAAFAKQQADKQNSAELADLRAALDVDYREAVEKARHGPPPTTVLAYRAVYGHDPQGWPPPADD